MLGLQRASVIVFDEPPGRRPYLGEKYEWSRKRQAGSVRRQQYSQALVESRLQRNPTYHRQKSRKGFLPARHPIRGTGSMEVGVLGFLLSSSEGGKYVVVVAARRRILVKSSRHSPNFCQRLMSQCGSAQADFTLWNYSELSLFANLTHVIVVASIELPRIPLSTDKFTYACSTRQYGKSTMLSLTMSRPLCRRSAEQPIWSFGHLAIFSSSTTTAGIGSKFSTR
ncbi:hypothetical protein M409DRAFT_52738 [Zasmidium cellare ATCC 36951]|uniref:Uncharacterized protein n=1 Tax=Zasmidium cellare ATCC 36951 TaxID=1080233 RepID=A0A6A6CNL1_ZASCE|nr:uncharacterized protein M409DRAFT_52738 [Zasmidium cellare ATCC 36951]KAF2168705.1 hypothetical protein M409DRAFT_52738 [Zasmidium cellare ATCC 36951]